MSLQTIIVMFVTCMAPLFLVYFVIDGIHMLPLDKTTDVSEKQKSDAPAEFKSYIVLSVACVIACVVLSIYTAIFGARKRAEEHAGRKTTDEDVGQRDEGEMEWFNINLPTEDSGVSEEDEKRFHFFDGDDGIGEVGPEGDSRDEDVEKRSQTSMGRF